MPAPAGSAARSAGSRIRPWSPGTAGSPPTCRRPAGSASCAARSRAGRIVRISAPDGATVITAADLAAVKPIRPMLHKFNYVPISQPVLASGCRALRRRADRGGGRVDPGGGRGHRRAGRGRDRGDAGGGRCARGAGARRAARARRGAGQCRRRRTGEDAPASTRQCAAAAPAHQESTSDRAGRMRCRWSRARRMRHGIRPAGG